MKLDIGGVAQDSVLDANKINNGIWVHLDSAKTDPETGKPVPAYLNGDTSLPQRALVRSNRSRAVKDAEDRQQKAGFVKIRTAKKNDRDEAIADASMLKPEARFACVLVALENVGSQPGIQQVDADDAKSIYASGTFDHWVQQITETSNDDANYAASSETEAGNESPSSRTKTPESATGSATE